MTCGLWYWETYNVPPWGYSQLLMTIAFIVLGNAFFVLMLVVLPQVFPDGLIPGRGWVAVLVASLAVQVPTVADWAWFEYWFDLFSFAALNVPAVDYGIDLVMPQTWEVVLWNAPSGSPAWSRWARCWCVGNAARG